jgi:hypothetical protein
MVKSVGAPRVFGRSYGLLVGGVLLPAGFDAPVLVAPDPGPVLVFDDPLLAVAGPVPVVGPVPVLGPLPIAGPLPAVGPLSVEGPVPVEGPLTVVAPVAGPAPVVGPVLVGLLPVIGLPAIGPVGELLLGPVEPGPEPLGELMPVGDQVPAGAPLAGAFSFPAR